MSIVMKIASVTENAPVRSGARNAMMEAPRHQQQSWMPATQEFDI
jgi:hypothetical protein